MTSEEHNRMRWERVHRLLPILVAGIDSETSLEDYEDLLEHLARLNWSGPLEWRELDDVVATSPELRGCA